jgi:hypothetical protein
MTVDQMSRYHFFKFRLLEKISNLERHNHGRTEEQIDIWADIQTGVHTDRQRGKQTCAQTDRMDRRTKKQTNELQFIQTCEHMS